MLYFIGKTINEVSGMKKSVLVSFLFCAFTVVNSFSFPFRYGGDYTFYYQSAKGSGYLNNEKDSKGFGSLLNFELKKRLSENTEFTVHLVSARGEGGEKFLGGYSFANINTLADDNTGSVFKPFVAEIYFTHYLLNGRGKLIAGKIQSLSYFDQNEFANDETTFFINKMFVNNVFFDTEDKYCPAVVFDYCDSNVKYTFFVQFQEKRRTVFENGRWVVYETGKQGKLFQNLTVGFQISFKTNFWGKEGNYRFYYYNNAHPHIPVFLNSETVATFKAMNAAGVGVSFDQHLGDNWGIFVRMGKSFDEVYSMDEFYSFGIKTPCPFFKKGSWLFAAGKLSGEETLNIVGEKYLETQWQAKIKNNVLFAVDFQIVSNLNGEFSKIKVFTARLGVFF